MTGINAIACKMEELKNENKKLRKLNSELITKVRLKGNENRNLRRVMIDYLGPDNLVEALSEALKEEK